MSAPIRDPVRGSSGGVLSDYAPKTGKFFEQDPTAAAVATTHRVTANAAPEAERAPWKQSNHPPSFAGDVATMERLNKQRSAPYRRPKPPGPLSFSGAKYMARIASVAALIAVVVIGYRLASTVREPAARFSARSSDSDQQRLAKQRSVPVMRAPQKEQAFDTASSPAGSDPLTVGARTPQDAVEAAFQQAGVGPATSSLPRSQPDQLDSDKIAAMEQGGAAHMTAASVPAARMMLQPSTEAESSAASQRLQRLERAHEVTSAVPMPQEEICKRDAERLARLRISQGREDVILFGHELGCEKLRPQVERLRESVDAQ
jgi:hypothetical protein